MVQTFAQERTQIETAHAYSDVQKTALDLCERRKIFDRIHCTTDRTPLYEAMREATISHFSDETFIRLLQPARKRVDEEIAKRTELLTRLVKFQIDTYSDDLIEHIASLPETDFQNTIGQMRKSTEQATVTIYPVMAIQAARRSSRVGGGYRLYILAKALDRQGLGNVSRDELRRYALSLGVSPRQWSRWIEEARVNDLVTDWQTKAGEWMLALPSAGKAAFAMGCDQVGNRKAKMAARDLIGPGWKARIWAAYEVTHNGRPISRERMQKIVNVPVSTQRYRDAQAGVNRQQNHAKLNARADALPMLREYGQHKGLYIRRDGYIGSRKPDSRTSDIALRAGKGRARKANATLHRMQQQTGLSLMRQAFSDGVTPELATNQSVFVRLFNFTPKQRKATERRLYKTDNRSVREIYEYSHETRKGSKVWIEC